MRALITGAGGFVGPHLAEHLLANGLEVFGLMFPGAPQNDLPPGARGIPGDLLDEDGFGKTIRSLQPDHVYHLAAISSVPASVKDPKLAFQVNVIGTMNLLEALRVFSPATTLVNVSTAHVYCIQQDGEVFTEESPVRASTPYDATKLMCESLAQAYHASYGLRIVTARPFNHIGPRQSPAFACSDFARQIANIRKGTTPPVITTGNLAAFRDFTDVRDVVRAYYLLAMRGAAGEIYNICSEQEYSMQWILDTLCGIAGVDIQHKVDMERMRSVEHLRLRGSNRKIRREVGWKTEIPISQTLSELFDYWMHEPSTMLA